MRLLTCEVGNTVEGSLLVYSHALGSLLPARALGGAEGGGLPTRSAIQAATHGFRQDVRLAWGRPHAVWNWHACCWDHVRQDKARTMSNSALFTEYASYSLGPTDGWKSPVTLCLMIIGVVLIILFIFWETKYAFPMMPPFIWKDRNFNLVSPRLAALLRRFLPPR